jgi:hypothetical protein
MFQHYKSKGQDRLPEQFFRIQWRGCPVKVSRERATVHVFWQLFGRRLTAG